MWAWSIAAWPMRFTTATSAIASGPPRSSWASLARRSIAKIVSASWVWRSPIHASTRSATGGAGVRAMVDRRLRIGAWTRVFLAELDAARAPAPPVAEQVLGWMGDRQTQLADTIFAMDRRAKEAEVARGGPDAIADTDVVNRIGQAAMLHAHTRFLVEALAEAV